MNYSLRALLKKYRGKVAITLGLLLLENIFIIIQPLVFGIAIDAAIAKNFNGIIVMAVVFFLANLLGTARRMYDTRAYAVVHKDLAASIVDKGITKNIPDSKTIAHLSLSSEIVTSISDDLPMSIESIIQVVGSIIIVSTFQLSYFTSILLVVGIMMTVYGFTTKKIYGLNEEYNDTYEKQVESISSKNRMQFGNIFTRLNKLSIKLSDIEAINYFIISFALLGLFVFVIITEGAKVGVTVGAIFAVLSYVLQFSEGIYMLPFLYQKYVRIREIGNRFNDM